jgi:hypothetical protein
MFLALVADSNSNQQQQEAAIWGLVNYFPSVKSNVLLWVVGSPVIVVHTVRYGTVRYRAGRTAATPCLSNADRPTAPDAGAPSLWRPVPSPSSTNLQRVRFACLLFSFWAHRDVFIVIVIMLVGECKKGGPDRRGPLLVAREGADLGPSRRPYSSACSCLRRRRHRRRRS